MPTQISLTEDETRYTSQQLRDVLEMIDTGNRSTGGLKKVAYAHGILGKF